MYGYVGGSLGVRYSTVQHAPGSGTEPDGLYFLLPREGWLKAYDYDYGYDDNHKDEGAGTSTYVRITCIASPITRSPGAQNREFALPNLKSISSSMVYIAKKQKYVPPHNPQEYL